MLLPLVAAVIAASSPPPDYRDRALWLCRPERADACTLDPTYTVVARDGTTRSGAMIRDIAPKADCFYVYPTASLDPGLNSDLVPGVEERGQAASQAAAFTDVCRVFAPMYRQVTLTALRTGKMGAADWALAYADIRAAFADYLARDNHGRPFVLIGHSQGSALLKQLVADQIDGKPIARQLLSAILPGTTVLVPAGGDVGGDFRALPLCRAAAQTGCIVTWASFREPGPPANGLFGRAAAPLVAGCTNPAALGGGGATLDAVFGFPWWDKGYVQYRAPAAWTLSTRFARVPGLVTGECVTRGGFGYLAVRVAPGVGGALGAYVMAPSTVGDATFPEWGLHIMDIHLVEGDLVRLVAAESAAWVAARD